MSDLIVEPQNDPGDLEGLEKQLSAAVTDDEPHDRGNQGATGEEPAGKPNDEPLEDRIPEKYRGKTLEEIIEMHQNLESAYGRMANDLGQQRKFTDQLLELKRSNDLNRNTPRDEDEPSEPPVTAADLLENPAVALDKYYEWRKQRDRDSREVLERLDSMETELARERFVDKHPDYADIGNDPAFVEWLQRSPLRQRLAQQALQGDWATADELLTEYKEIRQHWQQSQNEENRQHKSEVDEGIEEARKAGLESNANADASKSSSGKIYRRADLIRLKLEKPHIYEDPAFQEEIMRAYKEGRVR